MKQFTRFLAASALTACALSAIAAPIIAGGRSDTPRAGHGDTLAFTAEIPARGGIARAGWGAETTRATIAEPGVLLLLGAGLIAAGLARK